MLKTVLWGSALLLLPLLYWMLANETRFKKNLALGVTLPREAREDEEVQRELRGFLRALRLVCAVLLLLIAPCLLPAAERYLLTLWCLWLLLCIAAPHVPYVIYRRRLLDLKARRGWARARREVVVNTDAMSPQRWLSPWLFLPPVLLCLVPVLYDRGMAVVYGIIGVLCLLFWLGYRYLYRNKAEMVDGNTALTQALSQIRRRNWGHMWLLTAYATAALCLAMSLLPLSHWLSVALVLAVTVVLCAAALWIELRTRRTQEKLTRQSGADWYVDEDDRWIGGLFYYNPDDSRTLVNTRIGLNSTVNLAHLPGKLLIGLTLVLLLGLPFLGVYMDRLGTQEIHLTMHETQLEARAGSGTISIDRQNIADVALLEELPHDLRRVAGVAMDTRLQGSFTSGQTGAVKVLLDPTVSPFLLIRTADGSCYLLGSRDAAAARALYEALQAAP